jgi:ATP-binding cassette subfamily B multidrug efflux pump
VSASIAPPPTSRTFDAIAHAELRLAHDTRLARRLLLFVRPHWTALSFSLCLIVLTNALGLLVPLVVRDAFDARSLSDLERAGVHFLFLVLAQQLLAFAQKRTIHVAGARVAHDLRMAVIRFLQVQRASFFNADRGGSFVTRVTADTEAVRDLFRLGVLSALGDVLMLVGIVVMMLVLQWRLALVAFVTVPIIAVTVEIVRRAARRAVRTMRERLARLNAFLSEQIDGVATVQRYRAEKRAKAELFAINEAHRRASLRHASLQSALVASIQLVSSLCVASIFWYVGVHMTAAEVGFGTLVAFIYYVHRFFEPLGMLGSRYMQLQSSLAGAERIFDLLDRAEPDAPVDDSHVGGSSRLAFEFDHVTFGYTREAPVLRDVSFRANVGEKIAIVGVTGGGKSTLLSLLVRLVDVDDGAVRVGGVDVRGLTREALRRRFSVVLQDPFLFSGTVATNVAAGETEIDEARVVAALQTVGGLEILARRKGGIHALVQARGSNFSLGERQMVAFARALYRDAPILLLDEATASVDNRTDALLQRALAKLLVGRTALIIAHRLSTIHSSDRILVLHEGRIAESGSHAALMAAKGVYARAYDLQKTRETLSQTLVSVGMERAARP